MSDGRLICSTVDGKATQGACRLAGPFHMAIDQKDRVWVSNATFTSVTKSFVTRFSASDPSDAQQFPVGVQPKGVAIDSQGNAWISNSLGSFELDVSKARNPVEKVAMAVRAMNENGNVTLLRPDGSEAPGSPFDGAQGLRGPWGIAVDGDDHIWVANFGANSFVELCGVRTETCLPGMKTGDAISPAKTGYVGGNMQYLTDIAIDPAGNVWVANNAGDFAVCFSRTPPEALSTRCGGYSLSVFYGMAKPVRTPLIGPARGF